MTPEQIDEKCGPIETLIARYRQVNGFVASDGYEDKDENQIVEAAQKERDGLQHAGLAALGFIMGHSLLDKNGIVELLSETLRPLVAKGGV